MFIHSWSEDQEKLLKSFSAKKNKNWKNIMKEINYKGFTFFVKDRYYHDNLLKRFVGDTYEREESSLVSKYYGNEDCVLEIGSCLGYVSALLSKKCKHVISIEANPELIEGLEKTKEVNKLDNVEFHNTYISEESGNISFQTYDNIVAGSGDRKDLEINNVRGWGHTLKTYEVSRTKLTDIPNIQKINAMVIDCESADRDWETMLSYV